MNTYVIFRRGGWANAQELEKAAGRSSQVGTQEMPDRIRWIRSYVVKENDGRLGTICIYQGEDEKTIAEHARRAGLPCDSCVQVAETVVINEDPVPVA